MLDNSNNDGLICVICQCEHIDQTIEHIVPRALGNLHYILSKGKVCRRCNNRFSKFERRVLNTTLFFDERKRIGVTKAKSRDQINEANDRDYAFFLCKIFYESITYSKPGSVTNQKFEKIRSFLNNERDLKVQVYQNQGLNNAQKIPRWLDHFRLKNNHIELNYLSQEEVLWFHFRFAKINLVARIGPLLN